MSKLILSFFIIFSIQTSYSQEDIITESTPLYEQIQSALADLDLSEVTSNVFYEKGMSYYNWELLNGDLLHDSLALGAEHWNWAYSQTASSHIQDDDNFPEPTHFKELKSNWSEGQPIPIASLHFQYHRFREDAIDLNLISFDSNNKTFHDVPFRPFSPYIEDEFFIVTPLIKTVEGTTQTFVLEEELEISNLDSPSLIEIDFGSGYQVINYNQPVTVNFSALGEQVVTTKFTLNTGGIIYAKSKINLESGIGFQGNSSSSFVNSNVTSYSEIPDENNTEAVEGLELNIFYNCHTEGEPKLLKPLILIEGLDLPQFGNNNTSKKMRERLMFEGDEAANNLNTIITPSGENLWQEFYNEGYDFIYVDFKENGGASIFENGDRVREVIEWVNEQKEINNSDESNVIIGTSMGGLVGYWAMRNMEVEEIDHETEYFISFDTPFQGSNVALGLQYFIKILGNQSTPQGIVQDDAPILKVVEDALNNPAVKQMAYYHAYLQTNLSTGHSINHDEFYEEFHGLGELEAKHIAISNGSGIGQNQLLQQGEQYLKIEGSDGNFWGNFDLKYSEVYAMNPPEANWKVLYKQKTEARILIQTFTSSIEIQSGSSRVNTYDSGGGGNNDFMVNAALTNLVGPFGLTNLANNGVFGHCPVASALNISGYPDPMTFSVDACSNSIYRCNFSIDASQISPLSQVAEHNQKHVSFNSTNVTFLLNFLKNSSNETDINPLTSTYNFGNSDEVPEIIDIESFNFNSTDNIIDYNLAVNNQGQLWVNRSGRIDFTDENNNPQNAIETNYDFYITKNNCTEENTTVEISNQGQFIIGEWGNNIGNTANLAVTQDASITINNSGKLIINHNSKLLIKEGATLHIKENGILRALNSGAIVIENGGTLILDAASKVQLWDNSDDQATIHIESGGKLIMNGDIAFSGTGFFQFDEGNIFETTEENINLKGHSKETRFIQLNDHATLSIPSSVNLSIQNAKIVYKNNSKITAKNCNIEVQNSKFESLSSNYMGQAGIEAVDINKLNVYSSDFNNLSAGLKINSITSLAEIKWSQFNENRIGVRIENTPSYVRIRECQFQNYRNSYAAIYLKNCGKHIRIVDSQINGSDEDYSDSNSSPVNFPNEVSFNMGIRLKNVLNLSMINSNINNCSIGINGQEDEENDTVTKNNITMFNGSTIQNCAVGIRINGQRFINEPFLDFGSVFMDCARLLNNRVGVQGTDVLLLIDALENAGNETPRANSFSKPKKTDLFFDVCLETRADDYINDGLNAKGNYWSHLPNFLSIPPHYLFRENCLLGGSNLEIHHTGYLTSIPEKCRGGSGPQHPDDDNQTEYVDANCPELIVNTSKKSLHGAYYMLHDDWNAALISLDSVAKIPETMRVVTDRRCKTAIDFARTYVPKGISPSNYVQQENEDNAEIKKGKENSIIQDMDMNLSPNPTNGISNLKMPLGNYHLSVFSVLGQLIQKQEFTEKATVNLKGKVNGIYFLQIKNKENQQIQVVRIVKQ